MKFTVMLAMIFGLVNVARADGFVPSAQIPQIVEAIRLQLQSQELNANCVDNTSGTPTSANGSTTLNALSQELVENQPDSIMLGLSQTQLSVSAVVGSPMALSDSYIFTLGGDGKTITSVSFNQNQYSTSQVNTGTILNPVITVETFASVSASFTCSFSN